MDLYSDLKMGRPNFSAFVMYLILLVVLLGLINMVFSLSGFVFFVEFLLYLGLLLIVMLSVFGINNNFSWAWKLLKMFFLVTFVNMIFIFWISSSTPPLFTHYILVTVVGYLISYFNKGGDEIEEFEDEKVETSFDPGKYIASKSGTKYHAPKCDWAKKIKKANAVWYDSKQEAKKAGYKADACV